MNTVLEFAFASWSPPLGVSLEMGVTALVYLRGWRRLRRAFPAGISGWRLAAFLGGLTCVWVAVGSPLVVFDDELLAVHMVQHVLLMAVAPPLLLLGAPALPLLHGLPQRVVRQVLSPIFRSPLLQKAGRVVTNPYICWLSASIALLAWHAPSLFEPALKWDILHEFEHACFLATGVMFWSPVIPLWPRFVEYPQWSTPLYLFLATLPCDALSGFLAFCGRVIYPSYLSGPQPFGISPLLDQQIAAAFMWVSTTFIYLVPAVIVTIQLLSPNRSRSMEQSQAERLKSAARALRTDVEVAS